MRGHCGNIRPGGVSLVVALVATISLLSAVSARSAPTGSFEQAERSALLEVYAAESALARAQSEAGAFEARLEQLRKREALLNDHLAIARASHAATQKRIGSLLRALYESDRHVDPISIFLGATSLDEALEGVDSLSRAADLHRRLGEEAIARERELTAALDHAATGRSETETAAGRAATAAAALERSLRARTATLARIRREHALSLARVSALQAQASAAQKTSTRLTESATQSSTPPAPGTTTTAAEAPVATPQVAPDGTRTLTVDAVAYHLPGHTASGLPVGIGVIAVDPTVIPLGTRVFVPGYGPAVAADTGSAVKGLIIDLWMPTTAAGASLGSSHRHDHDLRLALRDRAPRHGRRRAARRRRTLAAARQCRGCQARR